VYGPSATVFVYVNRVQLGGDMKKAESFLVLGNGRAKVAAHCVFQPSAKKGRKNTTTDREDNSSASGSYLC